MSWAEQRRADRAAAAEQARADADAASARRLRETAERAELARRDRAAAEKARQGARAERRRLRAARSAGARAWATAHRVELLIYPLAVASAVMAVPSMAAYGIAVYGGPTGAVLPVLSELGMWAFALAVEARRTRDPRASVWALQAGVAVFAAVAAGLNVAHGLDRGISAAVVMGVVSVAGVAAHQLVTCGALRPRAERAAEQDTRRMARRVARAEQAAARSAVAEIDADGRARLVVVPGRYRVRRGWCGLGARRLVSVTLPGLPVTPVDVEPGPGEELAAEITAWLAEQPATDLTCPAAPAVEPAGDEQPPTGGGLATAERPTGKPARRVPAPRTRSMAVLRAEFRAAVADPATVIDPRSAESIRTTLRCSPARARQLRDEHNTSTSKHTDKGGDLR
jgi:hypothetical protein